MQFQLNNNPYTIISTLLPPNSFYLPENFATPEQSDETLSELPVHETVRDGVAARRTVGQQLEQNDSL